MGLFGSVQGIGSGLAHVRNDSIQKSGVGLLLQGQRRLVVQRCSGGVAFHQGLSGRKGFRDGSKNVTK